MEHKHEHDDGHVHSHDHAHPDLPASSAEAVDRLHTDPVVLDIGDTTGGLIVYAPADLRGQEVEVAPLAEPGRKTHTDVHARLFNNQTIFTGVFVPLPIGEYEICRPAGRAGERLAIRPGEVTELDWR